MTKGVFRVKEGWGSEDSEWVQYEDPTRLYEVPPVSTPHKVISRP